MWFLSTYNMAYATNTKESCNVNEDLGKRMLALACAGVMLVPLAACGSDADAGKIRLSYLSWDNEQTSKPYIDEFEKENPDIKIDFSYAPPTSEYISTLRPRLRPATRPRTSFIITSENRDDLIDNGYAKDLTRRVVHEEHLPGQQGLRRPRRQDLRHVDHLVGLRHRLQ